MAIYCNKDLVKIINLGEEKMNSIFEDKLFKRWYPIETDKEKEDFINENCKELMEKKDEITLRELNFYLLLVNKKREQDVTNIICLVMMIVCIGLFILKKIFL